MPEEIVVLIGKIIEFRMNYFYIQGREYHINIEDVSTIFDLLNKDLFVICEKTTNEKVLVFLQAIENTGLARSVEIEKVLTNIKK